MDTCSHGRTSVSTGIVGAPLRATHETQTARMDEARKHTAATGTSLQLHVEAPAVECERLDGVLLLESSCDQTTDIGGWSDGGECGGGAAGHFAFAVVAIDWNPFCHLKGSSGRVSAPTGSSMH